MSWPASLLDRARAVLSRESASEAADADLCSICLDHMDDPSTLVTMPGCVHKFHGQCLANHLVTSTRCPVCRQDGRPCADDPASEASDPEYVEDEPYVTFNDAFARGKSAARGNDPQAKRALANIKKWRDDARESRRQLDELNAEIEPYEIIMERKIGKHEAAVVAAFNKKHAKILQGKKASCERMFKAQRYEHAAKMRMAKMFGHNPRQGRSRARLIRRSF